MAIALSPSPSRPVASRRSLFAIGAGLAVFVAIPWIVRPLESLLPAVQVALIGQITETVLGMIIGAWAFFLIRRHQQLSLHHADEVERLTDSDALTGLGNERALTRELELALNRARRTRESLSVMVVDVDALNDVNRKHGRAIGDQTLRMLGAVLRSSLRFGVDASYRIADDTFAIVLAADRDAAQHVGRRLEWNFHERTPRGSNLSVGIAAWDGRKSPHGLIEEARRALAAQRQVAMVAQMA